MLSLAGVFFSGVASPCTPAAMVPAEIGNGVTYMEYDKTMSSGDIFPRDQNDTAIAFAAFYGMNISGCAELAGLCGTDSIVRGVCAETCGAGSTAGIAVASPVGPGPFPLFVYSPGTGVCYANAGPLQLVQEMVKRDFVSASIEYPEMDGYMDFKTKAQTLTNGSASPLGILCALENVDCSLGIASAGYSQGSHLANLMSIYMDGIPDAPQVTASLTLLGGAHNLGANMLYIVKDSDVAEYLPKERRRSVAIEGDRFFAPTIEEGLDNQKIMSGYDCGDSFHCLQSDGSGYFIIANADLPPLPASFEQFQIGWHESILDFETFEFQPWFLDGPEVWTMKHNLDWLAETAQSNHATAVSEAVTCGEVKMAYKDSNCCGNPAAIFRMAQRDRRLQNIVATDDKTLLFNIEEALKQATRSGGHAKTRLLAEKILGQLP